MEELPPVPEPANTGEEEESSSLERRARRRGTRPLSNGSFLLDPGPFRLDGTTGGVVSGRWGQLRLLDQRCASISVSALTPG
jgi:hypothetical protein